MYSGKSNPYIEKQDRFGKKKSTMNLQQTLNDIETCIKYLEAGESSLGILRSLLVILPSLRSSQSALKSTQESISLIPLLLNEFESEKEDHHLTPYNRLKSPINFHGNKTPSYFLQRNINSILNEITSLENQIYGTKQSLLNSQRSSSQRDAIKSEIKDKKQQYINKLNKDILAMRKKIQEARLADKCPLETKNKIKETPEYSDLKRKINKYQRKLGMVKCLDHWILDKRMKSQVKEKFEKALKPDKIKLLNARKSKETLHGIEKDEQIKQITESLKKNQIQFQKWKRRIEQALQKIKKSYCLSQQDLKFTFQLQYESFEKLGHRIEGLRKHYQKQIDKLNENDSGRKIEHLTGSIPKIQKSISESLKEWERMKRETEACFIK